MQLVLCILASIGGILLKIHVSHFTRFRYKQRKFCRDPSVIIVTFLEQQCTLFSESRIPWNGSFWKYIPVAPHTLTTCGINWVTFEQKLSTLNLHNDESPGCISASSGGIFLKISVLNPTKFQNNRNREFCGWCVIIFVAVLRTIHLFHEVISGCLWLMTLIIILKR